MRAPAALRRLRPRTIRARVAIAIAVALAVVPLGVQGLLAIMDARARAEVERALGAQAGAIASSLERDGIRRAAASAREAGRFIGDTRMVVRVEGEIVYWNAPVAELEARAVARSGPVEVTLERPDPAAALSAWLFYALLAVAVAASAVLVWLLSGGVARGLRAALARVTESAEAVAAGRLDVRVEVTRDELERLARAFNRMTERLREEEARQRAFLADVAHELRTPVTAIEGFATALGDGTASTPEDREESAEFIRAEAARLRELVRELQELTWLDLDPPVRAEEVDLGALGREAVARFAAQAGERGVALSGPESSVLALADPGHVRTILANLVANALAATPRGGAVRILARREGPEAALTVEDTGVGIPPEHLPRVFDRLYRVDPARDRRSGGSGLGLAIVRRLAALLGGRVGASSQVGRGSAFTLRLPAAGPGAGAGTPVRSGAAPG